VAVSPVPVRIVIVGVRIVVGPAVPRNKSEIKDEPGIVHPTATMPVPPMVAVSVPTAMPISRALRKDMIARPGAVESAVIVTEPIAAGALDRSEISVVLRSRETIGRTGAVESALNIIERTKTIYAARLNSFKISIVLESRDRVAAIESSRRKPALIPQ